MTLMTASPMIRDSMCFATILLFLLYTVNGVFAIRQKNRVGILLSLLLFLCTYFIHQTIKTVINYRMFDALEQLAQRYGAVDLWIYVVILLMLSIFGSIILYRLIVWEGHHVSPASVKESIDYLPSGLVFYEEDGSCLLVNHTMNRIGTQLTGHEVLDGRELERAAENRDMLVSMDGRNYQISQRRIATAKGVIYELVADDVTELHEKTRALSRSNMELAGLTQRLKQYRLNIDETVRKQEILQAKVQIHDEMNRMILATANAAEETVTPEQLQKLLFQWKRNALLLCKEADREANSNTEQDLQTLAEIMGITLEWDGHVRTRDSQALQLFELATGEALNNAAKHAKAKHLYVKVQETDTLLTATYTNDGLCPKGDVQPEGGLKNLSQMLASAGGKMTLTTVPTFTLTIHIPIGGNANAISCSDCGRPADATAAL